MRVKHCVFCGENGQIQFIHIMFVWAFCGWEIQCNLLYQNIAYYRRQFLWNLSSRFWLNVRRSCTFFYDLFKKRSIFIVVAKLYGIYFNSTSKMRNVLVTSKFTTIYHISVLLVDCIVCEAFDLKNNFGKIYIYLHWTKN